MFPPQDSARTPRAASTIERGMTLHRIRTIAVLAGVAGILGFTAALALAGTAGAGPKPRDTCTTEGAETTIVTKDGPQQYRCTEVKPDCLVWAWIYTPNKVKGTHTYKPPTCPCSSPSASATPTPSHTPSQTPSATPSASHTVTPSATTPGASTAGTPGQTLDATTGSLPVTGPSWRAVAAGVALVLAGVAAVRLGRKRKQNA